jgi:hypothetical protein
MYRHLPHNVRPNRSYIAWLQPRGIEAAVSLPVNFLMVTDDTVDEFVLDYLRCKKNVIEPSHVEGDINQMLDSVLSAAGD